MNKKDRKVHHLSNCFLYPHSLYIIAMDRLFEIQIIIKFDRYKKFQDLDDVAFAEKITEIIPKMKIGEITQNNLERLIVTNLISRLRKNDGVDTIKINEFPIMTIDTEGMNISVFIDHIHLFIPDVTGENEIKSNIEVAEKTIIAMMSHMQGSELITQRIQYNIQMSTGVEGISPKKLSKYFEVTGERITRLQVTCSIQQTDEVELRISTKPYNPDKDNTDILLTGSTKVSTETITDLSLMKYIISVKSEVDSAGEGLID